MEKFKLDKSELTGLTLQGLFELAAGKIGVDGNDLWYRYRNYKLSVADDIYRIIVSTTQKIQPNISAARFKAMWETIGPTLDPLLPRSTIIIYSGYVEQDESALDIDPDDDVA